MQDRFGVAARLLEALEDQGSGGGERQAAKSIGRDGLHVVLSPIAKMAEETGCTVLLLRHPNKANSGPALYRGGGSIGIIGAARAAFVVAPDPDDETSRVLACRKSNIAAEPPSLSYRLQPAPNVDVARVEWGGESTFRADALLHRPDTTEHPERDEAEAWLEDYLTERGRVKSSDVKAGRR
jgi:RecA-family ATPase